MENQVLSFEEIKKMFPDEWVLLGNPEYTDDNSEVISATVVYHAPDKRDIAASGISWKKTFERATMRYTGTFPKNRRIWL